MANPHPSSRGSRKGKPNKASTARIERAVAAGKRLPPEDMLLAAELCAGMASRYQPMNTDQKTGEKKPNKNFKEERYAFWLDRWVDALAKAAPYYAPRLMAMAVQSQVQIDDKRARVDPREVMLEIYLEMLRRGELTGKVLDARAKKINTTTTRAQLLPVIRRGLRERRVAGETLRARVPLLLCCCCVCGAGARPHDLERCLKDVSGGGG